MAEAVVRGDEVEPEPLVLEGAAGHGLADVDEAHPADGGRNSAVGGHLRSSQFPLSIDLPFDRAGTGSEEFSYNSLPKMCSQVSHKI